MQKDVKFLFGIIGSILLFIGVFAPLVSIPIAGSINYFQNGKGDGALILVLAVASFIIVMLSRYQLLLFPGILSLLIIGNTFISFQIKMSQIKTDLESNLADNPFRGLGEIAINSVQLQWGWALLMVGTSLVLVAGLRAHRESKLPTKISE